MATRGFRNNNPGNIEYGGFARGAGAVGSDGRFAQFADMDAGRAAMVKLLRSYAKRGFNTPNSMINRWAPPSDGNPTSAYAADVAKAAGLGPDDPVNLDDEGQANSIVNAMIVRENGSLPTGSSPIGTATAGGVSQNSLAGGEGGDTLGTGGGGMERLQKLLGQTYDQTAIDEGDALMKRGDEAAKGATNWLDVGNSALASFGGAYKRAGEAEKKKSYGEAQREALAKAENTAGIAKLLMASPDQATALKGASMLAAAEKEANDLLSAREGRTSAEGIARENRLSQEKMAEARLAKEKATSYNKTPLLGTRIGPDGKKVPAAVQYSDTGEVIEPKLPEGFQLSEKLLQLDTGLGTDLMGGTTHENLGNVSKNVGAVEAEKQRAEILTKAKDALPGVETNVNRLLDTLTKLETDPVRDRFTGTQGAWGPNLTAKARDYQGLLDQVQGGTFVAGFGDLRGGGAITEIEGIKAQAALNRLQVLGPSDKGYAAALADARAVFEEIRRNARRRAGLDGDTAPPQQTAPGQAPDAGAGNFTVKAVR